MVVEAISVTAIKMMIIIECDGDGDGDGIFNNYSQIDDGGNMKLWRE